MTPIEQLAEECGAEIGTWDKSGNGAIQASFNMQQLEALRQAIIKDFVKGLEPLYYCPEYDLPVFDLSQWRDK